MRLLFPEKRVSRWWVGAESLFFSPLSSLKAAWRGILALVFGVCLVLSGACSPSRLPDLAPEEIMQRSVQRMKALAGFHFVIDRSGAPAYLNAEKTLIFRRAEGDFVAPDQAWAAVRIIAPGLVTEIKILGLGDRYWETNPLSGEWAELPGGMGFNPAVLFDPELGFQPVLENDVYELKLEGLAELEEVPGTRLYRLSGKLRGERIFQMSDAMIGPQTLAVQLWVHPETYDLYRARIEAPASGEAELVVWQLDFWDFGNVVALNPPGEIP